MEKPNLASRLKELRTKRGLKQVEVATAVGIERSSLSAIENGHDLPSREVLFALGEFYEVSVDFLLTGSSAATLPNHIGEVVKDIDERALLSFWREMSDNERRMFLKMAKAALKDDAE